MNAITTDETVTTLERIANGVYEAGARDREVLMHAAKLLRTDPMDIAYLSMGALQELDKDGGKAYDWLNPHASMGQDGMIGEVIEKCLPVVQKVWDEVNGDYEGMFLYDVVEPLGMWFISEWVRLEKPPTQMACLATARKYAE